MAIEYLECPPMSYENIPKRITLALLDPAKVLALECLAPLTVTSIIQVLTHTYLLA
jgi:hypothetical protein